MENSTLPPTQLDRAAALLAQVCETMSAPVPSLRANNAVGVAAYDSWGHRLYIAPTFVKTLTDRELSLVLAHEVGHSTRRYRCLVSDTAIAWPLLVPTVLKQFLWAPAPVLWAIGVVPFLYAIYTRTRSLGPQAEEYKADAFAIKYGGDAGEYLAVLRKGVEGYGGGLSVAQLRLLERRYSIISAYPSKA